MVIFTWQSTDSSNFIPLFRIDLIVLHAVITIQETVYSFFIILRNSKGNIYLFFIREVEIRERERERPLIAYSLLKCPQQHRAKSETGYSYMSEHDPMT